MCPCGSNLDYLVCCLPFHNGTKVADSAIMLMRSRYTAYVMANADYILNTTAPNKIKYHKKSEILKWAKSNKWLKLEVLYHDETTVEFKAHFFNQKMQLQVHHERSRFQYLNGKWYYFDADFF